MNQFVGASIWHSDNEKCGKCGMKEDANKKGCCKDEVKVIKLKTDHQKASVSNFTKAFFITKIIKLYYHP
jgi:hypothetical protein